MPAGDAVHFLQNQDHIAFVQVMQKHRSGDVIKYMEKIVQAGFDLPKLDLPEGSGPPVGAIGPWATILMWGVLGTLLGLAVFLLVRYVRGGVASALPELAHTGDDDPNTPANQGDVLAFAY